MRANLWLAAYALALVSASAPAQNVRPWFGASVGTGRLSIKGTGSSGISGEASAGVSLPHRFRVGGQAMHLTAVDIAGDQPTWAGGTWLAVLAWGADSAVALMTGIGRIRADQGDTGLHGRGTVFETGAEFAVPPGRGLALRFMITRTWQIGKSQWSNGAALGQISQLHLGAGGLFR